MICFAERFGIDQKLIGICDISCDVGGSMEFMTTVTSMDKPFCVYDPEDGKTTFDIADPGILICSIDNMPAQFPKEATDFFGDQLFKVLPDLLKSEAGKPFKDDQEAVLGKVVAGAVIASNGQLTERFNYIEGLRKKGQK